MGGPFLGGILWRFKLKLWCFFGKIIGALFGAFRPKK